MKLPYLLVVSTAASMFYQSTTAKAADADDGCFGWNAQEIFDPKDWTHCQSINDNMYMYYTPMEDTIMLGLHILNDSFGWSALGPGGNGGMKGASQIVVRKNDDDEWIAEDRYSTAYQTPSLDDSQDVQLLFAKQDEITGETAWGVVIPQNSCDERDYMIEDKNIYMIYALGSSHSFAFHGSERGQFTSNLLGAPPAHHNMEDYDHFDFVMPNIPVVRAEEEVAAGLDPTNAFICSYYDMDVMGKDLGFDSDDKVHMVGYEPVFTPGNEEYLHHFTLFSCPMGAGGGPMGMGGGAIQELDDSHLYHQKVISDCTNMPPGCESFLGGWAKGNNGVFYPHNVGVGIGEGNRWLVLQTHYYNPNMHKGVYDSSGVRVHLTKNLRPIDGGIMTFAAGVQTGQHPELPGGQEDVTMETLYVEPDCTSGWDGPLNVFSVQHHSHFLGLHQEIVVERDGRNLGALRTEHIYDYNHQGGADPNTALKTLLPGDRLAATCHFDTTSVSANSTVQIGEESNKEMCFPTLLYYPKQAVEDYAYAPPENFSKLYIKDSTWCSQPAINEDEFESQCVEQLYTDVPGYSAFLSQAVPSEFSFDYPSLCNGGALGEELRKTLPTLCPDNGCTETQTCSEEELRAWAKGVCELSCAKIGLSLYPDKSRVEPYNTVNIACPSSFFDEPTLSEPAKCEAKGQLPQTIQLSNVEVWDNNSGSGIIRKSFTVLFSMILGSFLL